MVIRTNMLIETIKTVTQEIKQRLPHLPPLPNVWPNGKPSMPQYTATQVKKQRCLLPLPPHDNCIVIFSSLLF